MDTSPHVDAYIAEYDDWRGENLKILRRIIHEADPQIQEELKWNVPVFIHNGLVCAISAFSQHVKINFFRGAAVNDTQNLFNAGLEAKTMRSIDFRENDPVKEDGIKILIKAAVALNAAKK